MFIYLGAVLFAALRAAGGARGPRDAVGKRAHAKAAATPQAGSGEPVDLFGFQCARRVLLRARFARRDNMQTVIKLNKPSQP